MLTKHQQHLSLLLAIVFFLSFGLHNLSNFETSDEHFWRLERVPQYWQALREGDLAKTAINDKPGVSVALLSGIGSAFVSADPADYASQEAFTRTQNTAMRLPLILFTGLVMLPLLFWLLRTAFGEKIASISILLIGANPILIGMSQIINPDTVLWSTATAAFLAFLCLLKTQERRFVVLTGVLLGFALLAKYTANLTLLFCLAVLLLYAWQKEPEELQTFLKEHLKSLGIILLIALGLFAVFLPAVFVEPLLLLEGTLLSQALAPIATPLVIFVVLFLIDVFLLKARLTSMTLSIFKRWQPLLLRLAPVPLLLLMAFALVNAWLPTPVIPLDNLKEIVADTQKLQFPMFEGDPALLFFVKEIALLSFNVLFALTPLTFILTFGAFSAVVCGKLQKHRSIIAFCALLPFVFFLGGLISETFVTVRYSILLYPLFAVVAAIGGIGLLSFVETRLIASLRWTKGILILLFSIFLLTPFITITPHYLNYQSGFLPQRYVLSDSWSYGIVEAVEYLNALPNAAELTIWSDRKAACYYFTGTCIMRRKIDAEQFLPDYFIVTRRGVLRSRFKWLEDTNPPYPVDDYYHPAILSQPEGEFTIGGRPQNFIKIINREQAEAVIRSLETPNE